MYCRISTTNHRTCVNRIFLNRQSIRIFFFSSSWKTNDTILQRTTPTLDGRYPLHLNVTRHMHNQHLSCSALNSAGISEDIVVMDINCKLFFFVFVFTLLKTSIFFIDSPEFKSFPPPYTLVRLGDTLSLTCEVNSNPPANILWTKNGEFIGGGSNYQISEVRENDYGVYACIGTLGGQFTKIVASTKVLPPGK